MVSTRSSSKIAASAASTHASSKTVPTSVATVYPEATALRRLIARLNALEATVTQKRQQMHSYNLRPRQHPATTSVAVGPYNLRPRRQVCYVE